MRWFGDIAGPSPDDVGLPRTSLYYLASAEKFKADIDSFRLGEIGLLPVRVDELRIGVLLGKGRTLQPRRGRELLRLKGNIWYFRWGPGWCEFFFFCLIDAMKSALK